MINTPLTRAIAEARSRIRGVSPEETQRPVVDATPLRRAGEASEVAAAALFLVAPDSGFITGQTLDVCGGQLMR
jgi:NAD(P)-dependent dehydrogenase (short-subunit alcohol dehydrogenase family)